MFLTPFQFPLYRLADQISPFFAVLQDSIHTVKSAGRKPSGHLFVVDLFSCQSDITY